MKVKHKYSKRVYNILRKQKNRHALWYLSKCGVWMDAADCKLVGLKKIKYDGKGKV